MWLEDLANYVRDASIDGVGNNVFLFTLKADQIGVLLTTHTTGMATTASIPNYYKGPMQIISRAHNLKDALDRAIAIMQALDSRTRANNGEGGTLVLDTCVANYIIPRHYPVAYSRSDGDFYEASINFDVCFVDVSA